MASIEIPGYEIYEQLGRGGMATVYRALHMNLDREVALKVIDTDTIADESFSERFIREARISARLSHPHILQIYDVNLYGSLNYISMELLKGGDLEDYIRGAMTQRAIYRVMAQMTAALDYAAEKGYVHRDIKPSNIMMRSSEDYVLADFGIAKASNSSTQMTQAGLLVGTPSYMSPEQAGGTPLDGRSDLYSLAVVCYEMLSKQVPYESDSAVSTAVKHLTEDIPRLPEHLAAYQPFLDKALAKKADERFQTGREMYQAFCEVRDQFDDDDVLTEPKEAAPARPTPGMVDGDDDEHTVALWTDTGEIGHSQPAASRTSSYKLQPAHDSLLSGIRSERRPQQAARRSGGSSGLKLGAAVILVGALAGGGAFYWQQQRGQEEARTEAATEQSADLDRLVNQGEAALDSGDLARARELVDQAMAIDKSYPPAGKLELALVTAEQVQQLREAAGNVEEVKRVTEENVQLLLNTGNDLLVEGELEAAADRFSTAQKLTPERDDIQARLEETVSALVDRARDASAEGDFDRARTDLELASSLLPDTDSVVQLREALPQLEADYALNQQLAEARDSLASGRYTEAAGIYLALLESSPGNEAAREGLNKAADGMVEVARSDISKADFSQAEQRLQAAQQWLPDHAASAGLLAQLPQQRQAWEAEQALLAQREEKAQAIAAEALRASADGNLEMARERYLALITDYAEMPVADDVRQRLVTQHADAAREEIEVQAYDVADELIAAGRSVAPDAAVWSELSEEVELSRSNDRRRLGAY